MNNEDINRIFILLDDIEESDYELQYLTDEIRSILEK